MAFLVQEEFRFILENCSWGIRTRFEEGKVRMSYGSFFVTKSLIILIL